MKARVAKIEDIVPGIFVILGLHSSDKNFKGKGHGLRTKVKTEKRNHFVRHTAFGGHRILHLNEVIGITSHQIITKQGNIAIQFLESIRIPDSKEEGELEIVIIDDERTINNHKMFMKCLDEAIKEESPIDFHINPPWEIKRIANDFSVTFSMLVDSKEKETQAKANQFEKDQESIKIYNGFVKHEAKNKFLKIKETIIEKEVMVEKAF